MKKKYIFWGVAIVAVIFLILIIIHHNKKKKSGPKEAPGAASSNYEQVIDEIKQAATPPDGLPEYNDALDVNIYQGPEGMTDEDIFKLALERVNTEGNDDPELAAQIYDNAYNQIMQQDNEIYQEDPEYPEHLQNL